MSLTAKLIQEDTIKTGDYPSFLTDSIQFETIVGSQAYGVSTSDSDVDLFGWCIPPKEILFPHLKGYIDGFGQRPENFGQYLNHGLVINGVKHDITIYNIVKYFQLLMGNNPNLLETLYVSEDCIKYSSPIAQKVRDNRSLFLHKGSWHTFRGYAYQQLSKLERGVNKDNPARMELVRKYGYDVKFAYHVVRLLNQAEEILRDHTITLRKSVGQLKAIREGKWELQAIKNYFKSKEDSLDIFYKTSSLQMKPDEDKIKDLLFECLEDYYGSLEGCIVR